jgi:hypothetical protein
MVERMIPALIDASARRTIADLAQASCCPPADRNMKLTARLACCSRPGPLFAGLHRPGGSLCHRLSLDDADHHP